MRRLVVNGYSQVDDSAEYFDAKFVELILWKLILFLFLSILCAMVALFLWVSAC
ncbi:MAG: hypothetical protein R3A13_05105 [Bdellovibrionota bacterium]